MLSFLATASMHNIYIYTVKIVIMSIQEKTKRKRSRTKRLFSVKKVRIYERRIENDWKRTHHLKIMFIKNAKETFEKPIG